MANQEQTAEQLLCAALEHRPEDRHAFLDHVCAGAPELRYRVEQLLLADEQAPALDAADVPPVFIHSVKQFLSDDPARRCVAFKQIRSTFESPGSIAARNSFDLSADGSRHILTRRNFVVGSALTACASVGGVAWKWDSINNHVNDVLHPLPPKRFVALLNWPPSSDTRIRPVLLGVMDTIASELSRAEAFDRNLFVIAQKTSTDITTPTQLNELRESLGANLVLAASGAHQSNGLRLLLRVLDSTTRTLREQVVNVSLEEQLQLPEKAVRTAAKLLNIPRYKPEDQHSSIGTNNAEAYAAFLAAESLRKKENDTGLDAAIEKYKQAIEIDPRYAAAQARLAWAYLRSYGLHREPAALTLAGLNCKSAIQLDPNLVDAHLGLASFYRQTGDDVSASQELSKALALDPSDAHTLAHDARLAQRSAEVSSALSIINRGQTMSPIPSPIESQPLPPKRPPARETPEPLIDSDEAAAIIGIHPKTLQRYARQKVIVGARVGRLWRFRASIIDEWISRKLAS